MHVTILTTGSHGDVQPYVALGRGLRENGHRVRLATHENFGPLVRAAGLDFTSLLADAQALHADEAGRRMIRSGGRPFAFFREYVHMRAPWAHALLANSWRASQGADLILSSSTAVFEGICAADKIGRPLAFTYLQPNSPTRSFPHCFCPEFPAWLPCGGLANQWSHHLLNRYFWRCVERLVNQARLDVLGLPPLSAAGLLRTAIAQTPVLYGYSAAVVPRPPDWVEKQQVTGYWFLPPAADWAPDPGLRAFLDDGPPPVSVGFGSMGDAEAESTTRLVVRALRRARQRGVLLTGWGGLLPDTRSGQVFVTEAAPHDWLFPRVAAAVHHGGAGTTAAGCRAGIPSVTVPHMADQAFWGRRLHALGVAPRPIPRAELTEERLAEAIEAAVYDAAMRRRAAVLGERIRAEDGIGRAVAALERLRGAVPRERQAPRPVPTGFPTR